jgi:O-antigen ligase
LSGRESVWDEASSGIAQSPFIGKGIGAAENVIGDSFHNAYLEIWFNAGLAGLVLFLASLFYFIYRILYLKRICKEAETRSILALALGYIIGFAAMGFFESTAAGASGVNVMLYLFCGALVSNMNLVAEERLRVLDTRSPGVRDLSFG